MNAAQEYTLHWQPTAGPARAVALVLAGLNVAPTRMAPLMAALNRLGCDVLGCALCGHGANVGASDGANVGAGEGTRAGRTAAAARLAALRRVSAGLWRDEVTAAYHIARQRADQQGGLPVYLAAFSLGGLLGCDAMLAEPDVTFERLVLFAPALRIRRIRWLLAPLARCPRLVIPSATPPAYRANRGTAMAAYNALFAAALDFDRRSKAQCTRIDVPTLVFCDPQDELVAYRGLAALIEEQGLAHWSLVPVQKGPDAATRYHHLLIDAPSVGTDTWQAMMARLAAHLDGAPPAN